MAFDVGTGGKRKKGRASPEMNVTPLVDVVLVLLIIFMVVTPMLSKQFWLHVPIRPEEETPPPADAAAPVVVSVNAAGQIRINHDVVADADFAERLHRVLAAQGNRTVFFDAHDDAEYGRSVEALDLARAAGASTIAVATERLVRD